MPLYRISRQIVTDVVEVTAANAAEAKEIFLKSGIQARADFSHTVIEEVVQDSRGYREETSADLIAERKRT